MRKTTKRVLIFLIIVGLIYGIVYAWKSFPIITGYGAKDMCSCVFVSGRQPEDVNKKELGILPFSFGKFSINMKDSSATGTLLGLAKRKAIFRKGLGCTLINDFNEEEVRAQSIHVNLFPDTNQDSIPWSMGNLLLDSVIPGIDYKQLQNTIDDAFNEPGKGKLRQIRALLVLYDGKIIAEKYKNDFNKNSAHTGWSMAKSITNALIGILVKKGELKISDNDLMEEWHNDSRKEITLDELLHANSGLQWDEVYTRVSPVTEMLFKKGNMAKDAAHYRIKHKPGTFFQYSGGTTNILSYIIRKKTGENYYDFPGRELFFKTGMYSAVMEPDASGTFVGSSYCYASARDWARFGLLYLNDGVINGERILPEGWVKYTTTPSQGAKRGQYGAQFWLNAGEPGNPSNRFYPDVPTDCFWADGFAGQNVWIIPSKKLVIVRLSLEQGNKLDENKFLADIVKSIMN
jgi:CubicO group peptidase (beta-lactamase class C family)